MTRSPFRAAHAANRALAGVLALGAITIPLGLAAEIVVDTDQDTEIPDDGVPSRELSVDDLLANQDFPVPVDFDPALIQALLDEWNGT